jgi:hypothetical protein
VTDPAPLASHQIRAERVAEWLADSVNQTVTFHRTSHEAASALIAAGVDVLRSTIGAYGQGFYTTSMADEFFGEAEVAVAIRLRRPLLGRAEVVADAVDALIDETWGRGTPIAPAVARSIRTELLRRGYDRIIVADGGGDGIDYVIALQSATVKVIVP